MKYSKELQPKTKHNLRTVAKPSHYFEAHWNRAKQKHCHILAEQSVLKDNSLSIDMQTTTATVIATSLWKTINQASLSMIFSCCESFDYHKPEAGPISYFISKETKEQRV